VKVDVRAQCVERDGPCRIRGAPFGPCRGPSQWAHYGPHRRCRTVGRPPLERHRRDASFMMCDGHHDLYDGQRLENGHRLQVEALTDRGTDGPLRFQLGPVVYVEE